MYVWLMVLACLLAGCSLGSAAKDAYTLGDADNGKAQEMQYGETLRIELTSNLTTGYQWELTEFDAEQLKLLDSGYKEPPRAGDQTGAAGVQWWRFEALANGSGGLRLIYRRPWEQGVPPAQEYQITVKVGGAPPPKEPDRGPMDNPHGIPSPHGDSAPQGSEPAPGG